MILDVGCGTGRWAIEMAQQFPATQIIGLDLIPPELGSKQEVPSNFSFLQGDLLAGLPFEKETFDFVHMRLLLFAIPKDHWAMVIHELIRITRPGGWIETVETGLQRNGGPAMDQLTDWITTASLRRGIDLSLGSHVGEMLRYNRLANMGVKDAALPIGKFGGRLGMTAQTNVFGLLNGVKRLIVSQGITSASQYDLTLATAQAELEQHRGELLFYLAYGQRPF